MPAETAQANPILFVIFQILLFGLIFYFLLIRPQKKKDKQFKDMLASLEIGDQIITIGGFFGKITKIKDDKITFENGTGTEKVALSTYKWAIKEVLKKEKA